LPPHETNALITRIRALLEAPAEGARAPERASIERTLTDGYARTLALEAERLRLQQRIADLATVADEGRHRARELSALGRRLSSADDDLSKLRPLLHSLKLRLQPASLAG
jgi:chromosome segregation ATPase